MQQQFKSEEINPKKMFWFDDLCVIYPTVY